MSRREVIYNAATGQTTVRDHTAEEIAAQDAAAAIHAADRARVETNRERIRALALRAARYAKDPAVNAADQLSARLQHELLARLAIATETDDV